MLDISDYRVVAVTVTYNRTSTLRRCVDALLSQTRPADAVIIVDNNSREEEQAVIRELASADPRISVIWLPDNMGGAGGFEAGMRAVREGGEDYDFIWIMDDDAYPRTDCLEKLLQAAAEDYGGMVPERLGFLAPMIFGIDLQAYQLYHHKHLRGLALRDEQISVSADGLQPITEIEANAFVGTLISRLAVETAGVADGGMFIYGDDTEYTYRVSRHLNGYLVRDAVTDHQDPPMTTGMLQPEAWWKEYYKNRNRFFIVREFTTGLRRIAGYVMLVLPLAAQIPSALLKPKYRGFHLLRARMLCRALRDGLTNRRGKIVDPGSYTQMVRDRRNRLKT